MSFFFKAAGISVKPKPANVGPRQGGKSTLIAGNKLNAATLQRLGCRACPLDSVKTASPKMEPSLPKGSAYIYFLGDMPTKAADSINEPFAGKVGGILDELIPNELKQYCAYDNIIRDIAPKAPSWIEIECCRNKIIASIEEAKPHIIVGLGTPTLSWMLGSMDMQGMRGRMFAVRVGNHDCWFIPTYHPRYVIQQAYDADKPLNSRTGLTFKFDLEKAFKACTTIKAPDVHTEKDVRQNIRTFDGSKPEDFGEVVSLLKATLKQPEASVDWETSCLRPYSNNARILTAAWTFYDTNFSYSIDHPKSRWTKEQRAKILEHTKAIIASRKVKKIAHNVPFEVEWSTAYFGLDAIFHDDWEDTMMQAQFIDERRGSQARGDSENERKAVYQSLNFLTKQYFGIAIKGLFKKLNKKNMAESDLGETLIYNGADTKYTWKLYLIQQAALKKAKTLDAYYEALPRQCSVALMQHFGIEVSQKEAIKHQAKLDKEIKGILLQINDLKVVKKYKEDKREFNPMGQDCLIIFRDYLKRPEIKVAEKNFGNEEQKYRESTDKGVLDRIDHPLADLILQLRNRLKLKSTYVDGLILTEPNPIIYPDGKLHTSFNTTFAETGRTSSDEPNMQNFPKRNDAWVRSAIKAPKGYIIVAVDYGQLEWCLTACCTRDKAIVDATWNEYDVHLEWAQRTAKQYRRILDQFGPIDEKDAMKKLRSLVKNKFVFPAIFGATPTSIAGYLNMELEDIDKLMNAFWKQFHGLHDWQKNIMKDYYNYGYVETLTQRRRHYPLSRNQAINHPIQGSACDIVCDGMNKLSRKALKTGEYFLHPRLNIHDDLTFIIPDDDKILEESIEKIYRTMLSADYKWINIPLSVEVSIGYDWYNMKEIGKFWSHRDL